MNSRHELSTKVWEMAFDHWPDRKLIQCGIGIHPEGEYCQNCFYEPKQPDYTSKQPLVKSVNGVEGS